MMCFLQSDRLEACSCRDACYQDSYVWLSGLGDRLGALFSRRPYTGLRFVMIQFDSAAAPKGCKCTVACPGSLNDILSMLSARLGIT